MPHISALDSTPSKDLPNRKKCAVCSIWQPKTSFHNRTVSPDNLAPKEINYAKIL